MTNPWKDPNPDHRLSLGAIAEAANIIDPVFQHSPQYECEPLSAQLGCTLTMKVETANPIRSFKGRGADYFLTKVAGRGDDRDLVCASTGNFGEAMAYACRKHGRALVVFADKHANPLKVKGIEALGAEVRLQGDDFDAAKTAAKEHCARTGAWMIEDGREPEVSEGAGSLAVELMNGDNAYDSVTVPVGNGALITGVARWVKAVSPSTGVVGVSAAGADSMEKSWRGGQIIERNAVDTIAEGLAVRVPVPEAVEDMLGIVDDVVLVDDETMLAAMRLLQNHAGLLLEPAGAAGVAAIMAGPDRFRDQHVATVLTGSNVTQDQIQAWLGSV